MKSNVYRVRSGSDPHGFLSLRMDSMNNRLDNQSDRMDRMTEAMVRRDEQERLVIRVSTLEHRFERMEESMAA